MTCILLAGLIGSFLYAVRGGSYFGGGRSTGINRLAYTLPLGYMVYYMTGLPWETGYFTLSTFLAITLGHGLFMDMGRWTPDMEKQTLFREHEHPITWLIGPEDYRWSFKERWVHNFIGMSILGLTRHSPLWVFFGFWDTTSLIIFTLLGTLHGPLYELGHRTGDLLDSLKLPKWLRFLKVTPDKYTIYGEHYVGYLMVAGVCWLGIQ